jgi:hypothetical protein
LRVSLPPLNKWTLEDANNGRNADLFLNDVLLRARASKQEASSVLCQYLANDPFRRAMEELVVLAVRERGGMTWDELCLAFKQLAGVDIISDVDRMYEQLTSGNWAQKKDESVAAYAVRTRAAHLIVPKVPGNMMCQYFVKGLQSAKLRQECQRMHTGEAWSVLDDCIKYVSGAQERLASAGNFSGVAALHGADNSGAIAAFSHGRGRGRGRSWSRGRGRQAYSSKGRSVPPRPVQNSDVGHSGGRGRGRGGYGGGHNNYGGGHNNYGGNDQGSGSKCFRCGQRGHKSDQCRTPQDEVDAYQAEMSRHKRGRFQ